MAYLPKNNTGSASSIEAATSLTRVVPWQIAGPLTLALILLFSGDGRSQTNDANPTAQSMAKLESIRSRLTAQMERVSARGRIYGWTQAQGAEQPQKNLDAEFLIVRDGPRYHLQLLHAAQPQIMPPQAERLELVIFDGNTIYSYSSNVNEKRGGVFFEFSYSAVVRSTGYPFTSLLNFWDDAINFKELDMRSVSISDLGTNGRIIKEDRATYSRHLFWGTRHDFDLERVALRHPGASLPFREHWLTWQQDALGPFVQHYVVRHRYALREVAAGQIIARQQEIVIEDFSREPPSDHPWFTLTGLDIPPGTTFVDYRRNVKGKRVNLTWDGTGLIDGSANN